MKGQYLLPLCAQTDFSLEKPIELAEAQDVYAWVSHVYLRSEGIDKVTFVNPCLRRVKPGFCQSLASEQLRKDLRRAVLKYQSSSR